MNKIQSRDAVKRTNMGVSMKIHALKLSALIPTIAPSIFPKLCLWGEGDMVMFLITLCDNGVIHMFTIYILMCFIIFFQRR